jgi:hypothetical protein
MIGDSVEVQKPYNAGLQLRRAISIQAEGIKLLEKHAIAPSAARLGYIARYRSIATLIKDRAEPATLTELKYRIPIKAVPHVPSNVGTRRTYSAEILYRAAFIPPIPHWNGTATKDSFKRFPSLGIWLIPKLKGGLWPSIIAT